VTEAAISFVVLLCVLGGTAIGVYFRRIVPPEHVKDDTRQIANVAIGVIATLAALVLGLMVASAKSSFDARTDEVRESGARLILLDRCLRQYGVETREIRDLLRQLIEGRIKRVWTDVATVAQEGVAGSQTAEIEAIRIRLFALTPANDAQKWLHTRALTMAGELEQSRWMIIEENRSTIPRAFMIVLVSWLVIIFASLGLFAPSNATVYTIIFICAVSVATAIFLILEMDRPYQGVLQISTAPLTSALAEMRR
jgi:hypothetical protein